eukprot:TRINITY_DN3272_c0_g1_i5.p1 TRINITY_DN3272_c0_g1~~TRINITY_DN3272_c0_g1_i5.p1  ORF type:complete len:773 (+),score=131.25 TRINITY_DN3272_c0_g1_i5:168-2486(+)
MEGSRSNPIGGSVFGRKTVWDRPPEDRGGGSSGSSYGQRGDREDFEGYHGGGAHDDYGDYGRRGGGGQWDEHDRAPPGRPQMHHYGGPPRVGEADRARLDNARGSVGGMRRPPGGGREIMTLLVTSLSHKATERDIWSLFEQAGLEVESVHISVDRETGQSRGQAFVDVQISSSEDPEVAADFAISRLSGTDLLGRAINVELRGQEGAGYSRPGGGGCGGKGGISSVFNQMGKGDGGKGGSGMMGAKGAPLGNPKSKLVICQYWKENRCNRGELCSYAHGEHELRTPGSQQPRPMMGGKDGGYGMGPGPGMGKGGPPMGKGGPMAAPMGKGAPAGSMAAPMGKGAPAGNRKTQLCVYYKEGRCTRGLQCNYAHGEHELRDNLPGGGGDMRGGDRARPAPPPRAPGNRFEARPRDPRDQRHGDERARSPRRIRKVNFAKSDDAVAAAEQSVGVHGPPPPRQRGSAAGMAAPTDAVNGSAPKEDAGENGDKATVDLDQDEDDAKKTAEGAKPATPPVAVADYLLKEEGAGQLDALYGIGARLLRSMGWCPGSGVGANKDGELEPPTVQLLSLPSTHYGRKDRRCLGRRKPKRFRDSEESSPSRTPSTSSSRSSSKAKSQSSKSSSQSQSRKKRRKRRPKSKTKKRKKSSSSSRKSSSSSSSSSSKSKRKKKKKGKFTSNPGAAGAAAAEKVQAPPAPAAAAQAAVAEDPETAMAKKRVLAKLTELQKVEPKEARAKEFRILLRDWHPDKNPEKKDMATAVFQFLQKGKSLLNLK